MIRAINAITIVGDLVLLVMSLWPGYAGGCAFLLALPLIGLLGLAWMIVTAHARVRASKQGTPFPFRQIVMAPILVCVTFGLLKFYVPRRIAFAVVQSQFDACVPSAAASTSGGAKLGRRLGIYRVDEYAADPRGGVYFRTGMGPDGLGPDTMSYGFVFRPNDQGTPFGAARYLVRPLGNDWYWFQASDDWH